MNVPSSSRKSLFSMTAHPQDGTPTVHPNRGVNDGHQFWAVLIGIDAYPAGDVSLQGCVFDATSFLVYLRDNMGVPLDHIKLLLGASPESHPHNQAPEVASITATRSNIVDEILGLSTNDQIQQDDNIIIYFSGHGAVYRCRNHPEFQSSGSPANKGTIEAMCPMDRDATPDISDRELYTIIAEICRTKGHHITVILDCCHASGLTRYSSADRTDLKGLLREARVSSAPNVVADMFAAGDGTLRRLRNDDGSPRYSSISAPNWTPDDPMTTHVVLAACLAYECATAVQGTNTTSIGGVFTQALLSRLRDIICQPADLNRKLPTYRKLLKKLPTQGFHQNPIVAGQSKNERLWYTVYEDPPQCTVV